MPYSYVTYVGNGVTKAFAIPFGYLLPRNIFVYENNVIKNSTSDYVITTAYITFRVAPTAGTIIKIIRHTDADAPKVIWQAGSILAEVDMNLSVLQLFYLIQELMDSVAEWGDPPDPVDPPSPDTAELIRRLFLFLANHTTVTYP
jgi:hypothetical protein